MDNKELILKHAKVLFTELEDNGYGLNITIDVTDEEINKQITSWAKANGVTLKIKDYTNKEGKVVKQCQLKLSKFIKFASKENQYNEQNLGYGAIINLILNMYEYNNKFGTGRTASITNVFIVEPAKNNKMDTISE